MNKQFTTVVFNLVDVPNANNYSTVQVLTTGRFNGGRRYGIFDITKSILDKLRRNFERFNASDRVIVDYNHLSEEKYSSPKDARAAGWIQKLISKGEDLFAVVKWTEEAAKMIRSEEYKFISAAYSENYEHPNSDKPIGAWLSSIALTNRPFMRGMQPVALTEAAARAFEENDMKVIEVKIGGKVFHIAEDQVEDFKKLMDGQQATSELSAKKIKEYEAKIKEMEEAVKAKAKKLSVPAGDDKPNVSDEVVKLLRENMQAMGEEMTKLKATQSESTASKLLMDAVQQRKLTKAEADSDAWKNVATDHPALFSELIAHKPEVVPVGPKGSDDGGNMDTAEAAKRFNAMVSDRDKKLREEDPTMTGRDAYKRALVEVTTENPALAEAV